MSAEAAATARQTLPNQARIVGAKRMSKTPRPSRRTPATMSEVAALAGVSPKTVSNVVNNYEHVRPETRARVEKAIQQLDYQVNASARSLRSGRAGVIGLVLPELALPYFAQLADAVMAGANRRGISVIVETAGGSRDRELESLRAPRRGLTDGLIFSPLEMTQNDVGALNVGYPLVLLGERIFGGPVDHVTMANVEGARAATKHLLDRGCRRIAVVGTHANEKQGSAALRLQGHLEALHERGVIPDPNLMIEAGLWHRKSGAEATSRLINSGVEFDAIFALNDALALGALHTLALRGVAVPQEVKVIGFDDIEESAYSAPTLSTVSPGSKEIAEKALDMLMERIENPDSDLAPRLYIAPFKIEERQSTSTS